MTYTSDALTIKNILNGLGYKELEHVLDLKTENVSSLVDKGYSLSPENIDTKHITNKKQLNSVISTLVISYTVNNNTQRDEAVDSFKTAINAIARYHYGYEENPSFERHENNNKYFFGTAKIYIGVEQC
jgi:hypothetical protein